MQRAEQNFDGNLDDLALELAFYRYAHCQPQPLGKVKQYLLNEVRSLNYDLSENARVACDNGHPHPQLVTTLAKVISGEEEISTLAQFDEWQNA